MGNATILMATYNGSKYIRQQLDSIISQDYTEWNLYISDNGSTDDTVNILYEYRMREPRIKDIYINRESKGAFNNYHYLIKIIKKLPLSQYYFYCDQDDIWAVDKISYSIKVLDKMREKYGNRPLLCYGDSELINANGNLLGRKFSDECDIRLDNPYNLYFSHRYIWGTTMAHNGELFEMLNIPNDICEDISHDNYIGKYAATYGKIAYINRPLVLYRRHGDNASFIPKKYNLLSAIWRVSTKFDDVLNNFSKTFWATKYFIDNSPVKTDVLKDLEKCIDQSGVQAVRFIRTYRVNYKGSLYNRLAFLCILIMGLYKKTKWYK